MAADDPVGQAIAGAAGVAAVQDTQTLGGLGLDSLGLVELALALEEKTGKAVGDGDLRLEMTVEQVRSLLAKAPALEAGQPAERRAGPSAVPAELPLWPYTWGRAARCLALPLDLLYRYTVTRTIVLGRAHLQQLPGQVIIAGTHHSFPDMPLVRHALAKSPARRLVRRLVIAIAAGGFNSGGPPMPGGMGLIPWYGILALGLHPLHQHAEREASLRSLARAARAGHNSVLIFPQGTHARPEQELADDPSVRFHTGVALLAEALEVPVVPFGLAGTEAIMPPSPHGFRGPVIAGLPISISRGPLAIAFGPPVRLEPGESDEAFAARLQDLCYALTRQAEAALGGRQQNPALAAAP
jgi:1-acyl-sn-glycerol-3-phosphate acyltransferase/acyl carrier protein